MWRPRKSRRALRVVLLADDGSIDPRDPHCTRGHGGITDDLYQVAGALRSLGHEVIPISFDENIPAFIHSLQAAKADIIFNNTEAVEADRCSYSHIAAVLELLRMPYTGSGPMALALTMDKAITKDILRTQGVPVPEFFVVRESRAPLPEDLRFPLFVKPLHGGAKEGITRLSLVHTVQALRRQITHIHDVYAQPAICERYIEGRELTLGLVGNQSLRAFPVRELVFPAGAPQFFTRKILEDKAYRASWGLTMCNARLTTAQRREVVRLARVAYRALGLQDYGRMDIRLGRDGRFYFLEVNANPALRRPTASFIAPWGGISYENLIQSILFLTLKRHGKARGLTLSGQKWAGKNLFK